MVIDIIHTRFQTENNAHEKARLRPVAQRVG